MATIDHFMWGYQPHFRISQKVTAETLFKSLDSRLKPEIFLVGILDAPERDRYTACVEPEDDYWIRSEEFEAVSQSAQELLAAHPESRLLHTHPIAAERHREGLRRTTIREAISNVVDQHPSRPRDLCFYVSQPAKVDCYLVSVVLGLQTAIIDSYYSLTTKSLKLHDYRTTYVATSLIDAVADEFLSHCARQLTRPDPGIDLSGEKLEIEHMLRTAASNLAAHTAFRVDQNRYEGLHGIFQSVTTLSSLRYEKSAGMGRIILARRDHPAVEAQVTFSSPASLANVRASRKLLELTAGEISLHSDSEKVFGLAKIKHYDGTCEDLFEIFMTGHHHWELRHAGNILMQVQYGLPLLPKLPFDERKLRVDLPRMFPSVSCEDVERLIALVKEAERESHGTLLIISAAAAEEAQRLKSQATPVEPCRLTPALLKRLTPIDGAVLVTPQGVCHAIGTILDGKATPHGDPGRGARFNSALRYCASSDAACMAVVVSADGGVDIIPDLPPAIRRFEIDARIEELQAMKAAPKIRRRAYAEALGWLEEHRFYLRSEDCSVLNPLVAELENRFAREDESAFRMIHREFAPDPRMSESLFYAKE